MAMDTLLVWRAPRRRSKRPPCGRGAAQRGARGRGRHRGTKLLNKQMRADEKDLEKALDEATSS